MLWLCQKYGFDHLCGCEVANACSLLFKQKKKKHIHAANLTHVPNKECKFSSICHPHAIEELVEVMVLIQYLRLTGYRGILLVHIIPVVFT